MNAKNIIKTFVIALAMIFASAIAPTLAFGQDKTDSQTLNSVNEESGNTLEGVWKTVVTFRDCQTGAPHGFVSGTADDCRWRNSVGNEPFVPE